MNNSREAGERERKARNDGVTPVVGVMLMLTVTIVAVAVIAAFAGGLVNTTDSSPVSEISVTTSGEGDDFKLVFEHKGGDSFSPGSVKVSTFIDSSNGEGVEHTFLLSELSDKTFAPGMKISTSNLSNTCGLLGVDSAQLNAEISHSTPLEIKMYYMPTSAVIFDSTILLEEK